MTDEQLTDLYDKCLNNICYEIKIFYEYKMLYEIYLILLLRLKNSYNEILKRSLNIISRKCFKVYEYVPQNNSYLFNYLYLESSESR